MIRLIGITSKHNYEKLKGMLKKSSLDGEHI